MKLPPSKTVKVSEVRLRHGADWLLAWRLDERLEAAAPSRATPYAISSHPVGHTVASDVKEGEVRLLPPLEGVARPLYIYIVACTRDEATLIPFSRFNDPALPDEYGTDNSALYASVLCLWNARRVEASVVQRSWLVDVWPQVKQNQMKTIWEHYIVTGHVREEELDHTGPPLTLPDDPRWDYKDEESERLDRSLGLWRVHTGEDDVQGLYVMEGDNAPLDYRMAAEARSRYTGCLARYYDAVSGQTLECHRDEAGALIWTLRDHAGKPIIPDMSWIVVDEKEKAVPWHLAQTTSDIASFPNLLKIKKTDSKIAIFEKIKK
jgi:hypothetical protein